MKNIFIWFAVVFFGVGFQVKNGMAFTSIATDKVEYKETQVKTSESSAIYLLDWKENKLFTSKGVFVTDGIKVFNNSGIEKQQLAKSDLPPIVELVVKDGMVQEIIIVKHR